MVPRVTRVSLGSPETRYNMCTPNTGLVYMHAYFKLVMGINWARFAS